MQLTELLILLLAAVPLVFIGAWFWRRRAQAAEAPSTKPRAMDALDTLAAWSPERSRILNAQERQAYALLRRALPEHLILAQVPLARFLRVPTRNSYAEWMRRVGQLCADLVVCNQQSEVLAVIEVRAPVELESERGVRRHARMDRVLHAAGISLHVWRENKLPTVAEVRLSLLGEEGAGEAARAAAALEPPSPRPAATGFAARAPGPAVLGSLADMAAHSEAVSSGALPRSAFNDHELPEIAEVHRDEADWADEPRDPREPPPSTWFDDLVDSSPTPLETSMKPR